MRYRLTWLELELEHYHYKHYHDKHYHYQNVHENVYYHLVVFCQTKVLNTNNQTDLEILQIWTLSWLWLSTGGALPPVGPKCRERTANNRSQISVNICQEDIHHHYHWLPTDWDENNIFHSSLLSPLSSLQSWQLWLWQFNSRPGSCQARLNRVSLN